MGEGPKKKNDFFFHLVPYIVAIASAISSVIPPHSEDPALKAIKFVSDILALNVNQHKCEDYTNE